ncbi:copia-type polyprotein [Cucumis melo var. makuwa]|uniref:Copia-type polyprotein n=1 Tax=Cucumis melo var. makuwa TaxID=1194695 RepID=A0A5D3D3G8_CUCMM|nr:copia-type polyprotein [Cucumis melo var. makuwa]
MARSKLKCKKMPKEFWAQAIECAVYLSNRSSTRSLCNKTPQQAWIGRKPSIGHLRIFGCMAYAHILDQKRSKLDDKSEKYVFVGYDASSKDYKLYDPVTKKTILGQELKREKCLCTIFNATNGVRIKTWASPIMGLASRIIFEDIVMYNVKNPIIIHQTYDTKKKKVSNWKINDVHFKNIRETLTTIVAVLLECSELLPYEGWNGTKGH